MGRVRVTLAIVACVASLVVARAPVLAASTSPRACTGSDVTVTPYGVTVSVGTVGELFWIGASGSRTCTIHGHVRVSFTGWYGQRSRRSAFSLAVGQADLRRYPRIAGVQRGRTLPTATVSPSGTIASFWIFGTDESHRMANGAASKCIVSDDMSVWIPGSTVPIAVAPERNTDFVWCGPVAIYPVVPGDTGSDPPFPLSQSIGTAP